MSSGTLSLAQPISQTAVYAARPQIQALQGQCIRHVCTVQYVADDLPKADSFSLPANVCKYVSLAVFLVSIVFFISMIISLC